MPFSADGAVGKQSTDIVAFYSLKNRFALGLSKMLERYMIKPHEQLVLVSSMHCCTSTPSLSTLWSTRALQESLGFARSHLEVGFPLRCFQRLSRPYIATQRCHWRDNWNTRGMFNPVLSY